MAKASRSKCYICTLGESGQQLSSEQPRTLGGSSLMPTPTVSAPDKCKKEIEEEDVMWGRRFIVDKKGAHSQRKSPEWS